MSTQFRGHLVVHTVMVVSPGISNIQKSWLLEGYLDLVSEGSRKKQPAIGMAPEAAANFSTAHWPVFLENVTLTSARLPMGNNGMS